jgi:pilus assembly protein Flp/PilA
MLIQERGQGLVEYALILVLVSIVVIAMLLVVGDEINNVFNMIADTLATRP